MASLLSNDPLVKVITGTTRTPRRRVRTSRKRTTLTASERRIVNAVARRVSTISRRPVRRRRYRY